MSRLATLCTRRQDYRVAVKDLGGLYIDRGYPTKLVNKWIKDNLEIRWANRLGTPKERDGNVFVLKSHFNPLWDEFNVHELWDTIKSTWMNKVNSMPWCSHTRCEIPEHEGALNKLITSEANMKKRSFDAFVWHDGTLIDWRLGPGYAKKQRLSRFNSRVIPLDETESQKQARLFYAAGRLRTMTVPLAPLVGLASGSEAPVGERVFCSVTPSDLPEPGPYRSHLIERGMSGHHMSRSWLPRFDIRKTDFLSRNFIVSRKRNIQMSDLTTQWRKSVLQAHMDRQYAEIMDVDDWTL